MATVEAVSENEFKEKIATGTVLVDFYADWCGPCKMIAPVLERLAGEYTDVRIVKVNIDEAGQLAKEQRVMSIPTLVLFREGKESGRLIGVHAEQAIRHLIEE